MSDDPTDPIDTERVNAWLQTLGTDELEDVVLALSCRHCEMMPPEHGKDLKCLFDSSRYDALGMATVKELRKDRAAYREKQRRVYANDFKP